MQINMQWLSKENHYEVMFVSFKEVLRVEAVEGQKKKKGKKKKRISTLNLTTPLLMFMDLKTFTFPLFGVHQACTNKKLVIS